MKRDEYIERLCQKIRNKAAREAFREELNDHIDQKMQEFIEKGQSAEEAEQAAIADMGDEDKIAKGMNRATVAWYDIAKYALLAVLGYVVTMFVLNLMRPGMVGMIDGGDGPTAIYVTTKAPFDTPLILGLICITVILFVYAGYKKRKRT